MRRLLFEILGKSRLAVTGAVTLLAAVIGWQATAVLGNGLKKDSAGRPAVFGEPIPIIGGNYVGDSIRILENSSALKLGREERNVTAYFDAGDIFGKGEPVSDRAIPDIAVDFFGKRFKLVAAKDKASFLIMVRVVPVYMDYAIRNRQGVVSNSQVTILICRLGVGGPAGIDQAKDCRSTDYKFFGKEPLPDKLRTVLDIHWQALAPDDRAEN